MKFEDFWKQQDQLDQDYNPEAWQQRQLNQKRGAQLPTTVVTQPPPASEPKFSNKPGKSGQLASAGSRGLSAVRKRIKPSLDQK